MSYTLSLSRQNKLPHDKTIVAIAITATIICIIFTRILRVINNTTKEEEPNILEESSEISPDPQAQAHISQEEIDARFDSMSEENMLLREEIAAIKSVLSDIISERYAYDPEFHTYLGNPQKLAWLLSKRKENANSAKANALKENLFGRLGITPYVTIPKCCNVCHMTLKSDENFMFIHP